MITVKAQSKNNYRNEVVFMKKMISCIAILTMLVSMVSCGNTDNSGTTEIVSKVSATTSAAITTTADTSKEEKTTAANAKSDNKKAESNGNSTTVVADENIGASPVTKTDYMQIAGVWYEENVLDTRALTIDGDGTYKLSYRGGGSEYGNIQIERQVLGADDVTNIWYCFYREDGTLWESFRLTARENMSPALVSGFDNTASVFGLGDGDSSGEPDNSLAAVKRFMGNWSCGRCYISISSNGDGTYNADIKWSSSAAEGSAWTYICTYDAENDALVCSGSGVNVDYVYTEDGQSSHTENYNNGSAMFYTDNNGNLLWHDYYANVADEMVFTGC